VAGQNKPEFQPLLDPGFHDLGIDGIRRCCVERFPESITRQRIMVNLSELTQVINQKGINGEIWIDGSFLTQKLNPDDVDLVLVISQSTFNLMDDDQKEFLNWFNNTSLYQRYRCDNYLFVREENAATGEYLYAYWLKQFGFSRGGAMKGLAVVRIPFLVKP
jgi:hypothetical protein